MATFSQRKQAARQARRGFTQAERFDATIEGKIAARVHWTELRLRGFFPSHPKVYAMIDERLHGEWERLERLKDDCVVLLGQLAQASDSAIERGDVVTRARMNRAIRRG